MLEILMSPAPTPYPNWVPTLLVLSPDLAQPLFRAGIRDETSYLTREASLSRRIRSAVARARRDLILLGRTPLRDLAAACPPWVRERPLEAIMVPAPIIARLAKGGVRLVSDLTLTGDDLSASVTGRALKLALYRAGRDEAPLLPAGPEPAADRICNLVRSAPEKVLGMPVGDLPWLPPRLLPSLDAERIRTVRDLQGWSDTRLKGLPRIGEGTLQDLIRSLEHVISAAVPVAAQDEDEPEPCA
jgi:hypothetical protein